MASITKPVTYLGAMRLVERGLFSLSDRVTRYLPEFAAHGKEDTLVVHLFTHTSGLPDMLPDNTELRRQHARARSSHSRRERRPCRDPGRGQKLIRLRHSVDLKD
jgi:CubicO group peptidase (beta-lactamase class C family)